MSYNTANMMNTVTRHSAMSIDMPAVARAPKIPARMSEHKESYR